MKQRVSSEILKKYYELWLIGAPASDIIKKLKLSKTKFNEYTPDFLAYCRHTIKFDTRARLADGELPDIIQLTRDREREFLEYMGTGLSYPEVALIMNIPLITITDYWFKVQSFRQKVKLAEKLINARAKQAFYRRVTGYEFKTITENITTGKEKDEEGNYTVDKEIMKTTTYRTRVVLPDVNAGKFFLFNRIPDEFSVDGQRTNINNKGKILQWIEEQTEGLSENDMEDFDWEQDEYDDKYCKS